MNCSFLLTALKQADSLRRNLNDVLIISNVARKDCWTLGVQSTYFKLHYLLPCLQHLNKIHRFQPRIFSH